MAQAFGYQTWPDELTPELVKRLVADVPGMTTDRVFPSLFPDDWHIEFPPADRFITIYFSNFPVNAPGVSGGGNVTTELESVCVITPFVRLESDPEGRSQQQLSDAVYGVYKLLQQVTTSLQIWDGPVDAATDMSYFREPMRLSPGFRIDRKTSKGQKRWAVCPMSWQIAFVADLSAPYPSGGRQ